MIPERKLSSTAPGEARRKHVYCSSCELQTSPGLPHSLRMQTSGTRLLRSCTQFERCPASGQQNNYCTGIYLITALRGKFRLSAACLFPGIRRLSRIIQPVRSHVRPSVRRSLAVGMGSGFLDGSQFPLLPTPETSTTVRFWGARCRTLSFKHSPVPAPPVPTGQIRDRNICPSITSGIPHRRSALAGNRLIVDKMWILCRFLPCQLRCRMPEPKS